MKCKTCEEDTSKNGTYHVPTETYQTYGDYCYITQERGWVDAKEVCVNITAHLPHIKLINEQKEIGSIAGV